MSAVRFGFFSFGVRGLCARRLLSGQTIKPKFFSTESKKKSFSTFKLGALGVVVGAVVGTGYSLWTSASTKTDHIKHEEVTPLVITELPDFRITKKVINPEDNTGLDLVLFQFQTCPFCCKVRAFLDSQGLSYSVVEVDAVLRQDLKWSNYRKVPILLAKRKDGKYVQLTDSSTIISVLASYLNDQTLDIGDVANFYPSISYFDESGIKKNEIMNKYFIMYQNSTPGNLTNENMRDERKWRSWVDDELVHLISPNVYRTRSEAFETFEWFSHAGEWSKHFPSWERNLMVYVGANAMWLISKRLKKRHGFSDDVRGHMYDALGKLTSEMKVRGAKFLGGNKPNLADISIYGVLCSMEGCAAFKECLENTEIDTWFFDMKAIINKNRGSVSDKL